MDIKRAAEMPELRQTGEAFESQVHKRKGVTESFNDYEVSLNEVIFAPGERTRPHRHTIRQLLYVTGGSGIVATEDEETLVLEGDPISIPSQESHWHDATDEEEFRHISVVIRDPEFGGTLVDDTE